MQLNQQTMCVARKLRIGRYSCSIHIMHGCAMSVAVGKHVEKEGAYTVVKVRGARGAQPPAPI